MFLMTSAKSKFKFYFQLYTFNTTTVSDKPSPVSFVNAFATGKIVAITIFAPVHRPLPLGINYCRVHLLQILREDKTLSLHTRSWKDVIYKQLGPWSRIKKSCSEFCILEHTIVENIKLFCNRQFNICIILIILCIYRIVIMELVSIGNLPKTPISVV